MESESILASQLQHLSKEYGLLSESETAVVRPSDYAGTLSDFGLHVPVDLLVKRILTVMMGSGYSKAVSTG